MEKKLDRCVKFIDAQSKAGSSSNRGRPNHGGGRGNNNNNGNSNNNRSRGNGGGNTGGGDKQAAYLNRIKGVCVLYNSGACNVTPCDKGLKHVCSKITDPATYRLCFATHPAIDH